MVSTTIAENGRLARRAATASTANPPEASLRVDPCLEAALERLLLCNQIRELADEPRPVRITQIPKPDGLQARLIRRIARAGGLTGRRPSAWRIGRWVVLDACVLVWLRVALSRGRVWRIVRPTMGALARHAVLYRTRYYACPSSQMTGYVRCTDKEEPLIRACLLLRTMKRYAACIELLRQRLASGLPAEHTRRWLAFFLREVGDAVAAERIAPDAHRDTPGEARDRIERSADGGQPMAPPPRLKYGIVISTMFDSEVFRSSLRSVLGSDFQGRVVVAEDGYAAEAACRSFCEDLDVLYVKNPQWTGLSPTVDLGIRQLDPDTDVILHVHSDVLWPRRWFHRFNEAWETGYDAGRIGILNLGFLQFRQEVEPALSELFIQGRHEDLAWILNTRKAMQPEMDGLEDLQHHDPGRVFGLVRDSWADHPGRLQFLVGKCSVGMSFLRQAWEELGGLSHEMGYGIEMEIPYHSCVNRKWNLWINNSPLIHMRSTDTGRLRDGDVTRFYQIRQQSYDRFAEQYGWDWDHFSWTFFAETCVIYHDDIIEAANAVRFDKIDFVFDEFTERLRRKRLASCELAGCRRRTTCPYA